MKDLLERYRSLGIKVKKFNIKKSIRITNKIKVSNLINRLKNKGILLKKIGFLDKGFYVTKSRFSLASTPEYLLGYFFIQEAASQLPAEILEPEGIVLDMCASPGGKTIQLAEKAKVVIALENQHNRIKPLLNNLERVSVKNCIVYNIDARKFEFKVDKILLDAPCSGNFIMDNKWFKRQTVENFEKNSELQKELISAAIGNLKKGGELVYSTCSLEPEENEFVIDYALKNFDIDVVKIKCPGDNAFTRIFGKKLDKRIRYCKRLLPHKTKTQGFFIAKLRKND